MTMSTMTLPGNPVDCKYTRLSSKSIKLEWKVLEENELQSYILTLETEKNKVETILNGPYTDYILANLELNIEYTIKIKASFDGINYGNEGIFEPFILHKLPPTSPRNAKYNYYSSNEIYISWDEPDDDGGDPIHNYLITTNKNDYIFTANGTGKSAIIQNINHKDVINISIKATNDNISYGPELILPTIYGIKAPTESVSSAVAEVVSAGVVKITWSESIETPEGKYYYIIQSKSSNPNDPTIGACHEDFTNLECDIAELNPNSEYYFSVFIQNQVGESPKTSTNTIKF